MAEREIEVGQSGVVELIIRMTPDGQVTVTGPIQNRVLVYGMLEMAKDAVRAWGAPRIVPGAEGPARTWRAAQASETAWRRKVTSPG